MPYSIDIHIVVKTVTPPITTEYTNEAVAYSGDYASIPDEVIRTHRIDDYAIDPVDMFATAGRKCKVELSIFGTAGWISESGYSTESHPDYNEWYPFIFTLRRDGMAIFIGALKKQNYSLNELSGTETLILSDAVDIWVDCSKGISSIWPTTNNYWDMEYYTLALVSTPLYKWGSILRGVSIGAMQSAYNMENILLQYPGLDLADLFSMWAEHGPGQNTYLQPGDDFYTQYTNVWQTPNNEIQIVFWIKYRKNMRWYAQGYRCWLLPNDPFNVPRPAQYIGTIRDGYNASSESALMNLLVLNGVLQNTTQGSVTQITVSSTTVSAGSHFMYVSGLYDPTKQTVIPGSQNSDVVKAMLVTNMAIITTRPWNWYGGSCESLTRIVSIINPNTSTDQGSVPITKAFTSDEITHITKRAVMISESMYNSLNVLLDKENKVNLMKAIYSNLLNAIRYTITFSYHHAVAGTASLVLGDCISTSATTGLWYITAISDEDENGLITITAAGGY